MHAERKQALLLTLSFRTGAILDAIIALEWFLISAGHHLPVFPSFYSGSGPDFQFAMKIAAMFMLGWAVLLYWGSRNPRERKGLLLITAAMLSVSFIMGLKGHGQAITAGQKVFGSAFRLFLVVLFSFSYFYPVREGR